MVFPLLGDSRLTALYWAYLYSLVLLGGGQFVYWLQWVRVPVSSIPLLDVIDIGDIQQEVILFGH